MAQAIVDFALGKLCEAVFQEVVALCGVDEKVASVERELTRIQCFLKDADRKASREERVKNWVEELRKVSVMIRDATDTFLGEVDIWAHKKAGVVNKIERMIKKPKQLAAKRQLGKTIDDILKLLKEIDESRERFGIENLGKDIITESAVRVGPNRFIIPDLDDLQVVGFVADKKKITDQLLDGSISRRSVVSIVGTGGLGKTTLAHKVYASDDVKNQFEFQTIDLLKKVIRQLRPIEDNEKTNGEAYFIGEVNKALEKKKYLIVLDDVWCDNLWLEIKTALPDVSNGSRVLMTSRLADIAKAADPTSKPYQLPFLEKEESLQLLLRTALPNQECPTNLLEIAQQFVAKCDGLPLAIVVLGGLLSKKEPKSPTIWLDVFDTMDWNVEGESCMTILSTSYNHMPEYLKPCFMYLACFPEDYEINAGNLIRLWVAEGFIPQSSRKTLEKIAELYLEQLAERYMVIVVHRRYDESIKTVRVHDVILNLAIDKAKQNNFITVPLNKDVNGSQNTASCRVALQPSFDDQLKEHASLDLHSLHYFRCDTFPDFSKYEMLEVCNIEANHREGGTIGLERSNQLRFLRVSSQYHHLGLNLYVGQLKNIQTLDLRYLPGRYRELQLSEVIWGYETLRHVLFSRFDAVRGPPSGAMLRNLQTLGYVVESESWGTQLPDITNVRCLKLQTVNSFKTIASLLRTLRNLISLTLENSHNFIFDKEESILNMQTFPFYKCLRKLRIRGGLGGDSLDLPTIMLPRYLSKLQLEFTGLRKDPMPALEKHQSLKVLILIGAYDGKKMICSAGGFPCLEQLELSYFFSELQQFEIKKGAMPTLKQLKIEDCWVLERLEIEEGAMPILDLLEIKDSEILKPPSLHWTSCRIQQKPRYLLEIKDSETTD